MKKLVAAVVVATLALAMAPGASVAKPKKKKKFVQTQEGSVLFPSPFLQGNVNGDDGCWGGLHRRIETASGGQGQGVFGYGFPIDKRTWNKPFKLEATGGEGSIDLDLFIYTHVPPVTEWPDDPVNAGTPASSDFQEREPGGEAGKVPPNTTHAIVCLYGGPSGNGFNATFKYTAG